MSCLTSLRWRLLGLALASAGCSFGPRALESTHGQYNEAVKRVAEEELLLNVVRLRYDDNLTLLDVSSIATQYEVGAQAEMRPFFGTQAARIAERQMTAQTKEEAPEA